jgi:hypothetical protein
MQEAGNGLNLVPPADSTRLVSDVRRPTSFPALSSVKLDRGIDYPFKSHQAALLLTSVLYPTVTLDPTRTSAWIIAGARLGDPRILAERAATRGPTHRAHPK